MNLDMWGSHPVAKIESAYTSIASLQNYRKKGYEKLKKNIQVLTDIIKDYSNSENQHFKKVIEYTEIVVQYLKKIESFLKQRQVLLDKRKECMEIESSHNKMLKSIEQDSATSKTQNASLSLADSDDASEKLPSPTDTPLTIEQLPDETKIGYLLCLNCGHNNNLSLAELNQYEKHLINANIISQ